MCSEWSKKYECKNEIWVNEAKRLVQHESCNCKCGFNESVCVSKQKRNHGKCRRQCKELNDWVFCKDDYMES